MEIVDKPDEESTKFDPFFRSPVDQSTGQLCAADPFETFRHGSPLGSGFDENDAPVLRACSSLCQSSVFEDTHLPAHGTRIHSSRLGEIAHWEGFPITQGSQDVHGLLREFDSRSTSHAGMNSTTREQTPEPVESESDGTQLVLDG